MHELAITKKIMGMVEKEVENRKVDSPKSITVEVGEMTTFKEFALVSFFDTLKKESKYLKDSELKVIMIPTKIKCKDCGKERVVEEPFFMLCPECASTNIEVIQGDDIKIKEMSV